MTHVALAASYHAGKFLQPRDPSRRVYFPEDGTVYFKVEEAKYGLLKPQQATAECGRDVFAAACRGQHLRVRAWTVLNHNSRLGFLHPEVVARNAWDDPYYYSLCPSHGAVRDYAVTLCSELGEKYPLECLLLETPGWMVYDHGYHHEFAQVDVTDELARLLGLCFCDACTRDSAAAGVDALPLKRAVVARCDELLAGDAKGSAVCEADLAPFHAWRATVVTDFCRRIRDEVPSEVGVRVISTCQRPHSTAYLEGTNLAALASVCDGLELPLYQPSAREMSDDLRYVVEAVGSSDRLSAIVRPGLPDMRSAEQLGETLAALTAAGIDDLSFYNFGLLPAKSIDWTEQAVGSMWSAAQ
jgi:hypothetical protein